MELGAGIPAYAADGDHRASSSYGDAFYWLVLSFRSPDTSALEQANPVEQGDVDPTVLVVRSEDDLVRLVKQRRVEDERSVAPVGMRMASAPAPSRKARILGWLAL